MISAIMAVYNSEKYIAKTIKSILQQSSTNFEFIIIDDGSTDNSLSIVKQFAKKDKRIIIIYNNANEGISRSRNKGLAIAKGEYMAVVDSDDISLPERFAKQVQFLEYHLDYCGVGSEVIYIDPEGWPINRPHHPYSNEKIDTQLLQGNGDAIPHPSFMCRTDTLRKIKGYDETFINGIDLDLYLRLIEVGRLANLEDIFVKVRRRETSISHQRSDLWREMKYKALTKTMQRRGIEIDLGDIKIGNMVQSDYRLYWGVKASKAGHFHTAIKNLVISSFKHGFKREHTQFIKSLIRDIYKRLLQVGKPG